jgi:uncharacterized protein YkwD
MTFASQFRHALRWLPTLLIATLLATLVTVSTPRPTLAVTASEVELSITNLVNKTRTDAGLRALRTDSDLSAIAGLRANRMRDANVLNHTVGGSLQSQLAWYDVPWYRYGENVGYTTYPWGSQAAKSIHGMWLRSSSHKALIMSSRFNYVGVGAAYRSSNGRTYASIVFSESPDHTSARASFTAKSRSGDDIIWTWSGYDPALQTHTAGLRDYDVQYRTGSGSWSTLRNDSTSRSVTLTNRRSGTYGLRVRATDRRGNVGPWTAESRISVP